MGLKSTSNLAGSSELGQERILVHIRSRVLSSTHASLVRSYVSSVCSAASLHSMLFPSAATCQDRPAVEPLATAGLDLNTHQHCTATWSRTDILISVLARIAISPAQPLPPVSEAVQLVDNGGHTVGVIHIGSAREGSRERPEQQRRRWQQQRQRGRRWQPEEQRRRRRHRQQREAERWRWPRG